MYIMCNVMTITRHGLDRCYTELYSRYLTAHLNIILVVYGNSIIQQLWSVSKIEIYEYKI